MKNGELSGRKQQTANFMAVDFVKKLITLLIAFVFGNYCAKNIKKYWVSFEQIIFFETGKLPPVIFLMLLTKLKCRSFRLTWYFLHFFALLCQGAQSLRHFLRNNTHEGIKIKGKCCSLFELSEPLDILFISNDGKEIFPLFFSIFSSEKLKKLTFYWVYLIIKSFPLEKEKRETTKEGEEKQAHNSIKYLFDSNVFIDEKRLGMFFHIFLLRRVRHKPSHVVNTYHLFLLFFSLNH